MTRSATTIPPFPRTPYPFDQAPQHSARALDSISEWLELHREDEHPEADEFNVESLALTPSEWLACNGAEDETWVVGAPDWMNESNGVGPMITDSAPCKPISPCTPSPTKTESSSDLYSPEDYQTETVASAMGPDDQAPSNKHESFAQPSPRGVVRRRSIGSVAECQLPERKRPRLERLLIDTSHPPVGAPRLLTPAQIISFGRTPVSPAREFSRIVAERKGRAGVMFKVVWRESWVHESKMPDVEPIRNAQLTQWGHAWDVIPGSPIGRVQQP